MHGKLRLKLTVSFFTVSLMGALVSLVSQSVLGSGYSALALTFAIVFVFGLVGGGLLADSLVHNIRVLSDFASRVALGDLSQNAKFDNQSRVPDEVDALAGTINYMLDNLRELVSHMRDTSHALAGNANELAKTAVGISTAGEDITYSIEQIAEGAELQSQLVERAKNLITEIALGIQRTASAATDAAAASKETALVAQSGSEVGRLAIDKLHKVFERVEGTGGLVVRFGEKSREISKIVEFITKLSQQTNLLALNASIEAARAGEYGRGFAVVADEIRKLAENSAQSTDQISDLVEESLAEARRAVEAVRESIEELSLGREDMSTIIGSLDNISVTAKKAAEIVSQISNTTRDQLAGAREMVSAIENLHDVAETNALATDQVKKATGHQTSTMQWMASSADEMTKLSRELERVVTRFRLRPDTDPPLGVAPLPLRSSRASAAESSES